MAPGGDLRFLTRLDGAQFVIFGPITLNRIARQLNMNAVDNGPQLTGRFLDLLKTDFSIKPENVMPFGLGKSTYKQQLAGVESINEVSDKAFSTLKNAPYSAPSLSYDARFSSGFSYDTDLVINSLDGRLYYVNSDALKAHPQIADLASHFNIEVAGLPSATSITSTRIVRTSYINWLMGIYKEKKFVLLPTQANAKALTSLDEEAIDIIRTRNPEVEILPLGENSADMFISGPIKRNYGPRCLTNYLLNS